MCLVTRCLWAMLLLALLASGCRAQRVLVGHDRPAPAPVGVAAAATAPGQAAGGLTQAWSFGGQFAGLATDPQGDALYAYGFGGLVKLDAAGRLLATLRQPRDPAREGAAAYFVKENLVRVGDLDGDGGIEFVVFGAWGKTVSAIDHDGSDLWTYAGPDTGTDDVWVGDLDGDGPAEVVIGYNGNGGLHVAEGSGRVRWKNDGLGNCWHVCAGDLDGDGAVEVLSTEAGGRIHVFDAAGAAKGVVAAPVYANMVRLADDPNGTRKLLVGAGSSRPGVGSLFCVSADGKARWAVDPPGDIAEHFTEMQAAPGRPWVAGLNFRKDGAQDIVVVDLADGTILATENSTDRLSGLTWVTPAEGGDPLLVVTSDTVGITAYKVLPQKE